MQSLITKNPPAGTGGAVRTAASVIVVVVMMMVMVPMTPDDDRAMMVVMVMTILHGLQLRFACRGAVFLVHGLKNGAGVRNGREKVGVGIRPQHVLRRCERRGLG